LSSWITQKYATRTWDNSFVLNTYEGDYRPLECIGCKEDILNPELIRSSMAMLHKDSNDVYHFLYGCKSCISHLYEEGWIEIFQALHAEQLAGWNNLVEDRIKGKKISPDFFKNKSYFDSRIIQRMFPSNMGTWL